MNKTVDFGQVAVLMGGWSSEREISLLGGRAVLQALRDSGIKASAFDVRAPGRDLLAGLVCDRVFIMLHGRGGEDGSLEGMLELLGIPYTGSGVMTSALCMDKVMCKRALLGAGLPTPDFVELGDEEIDPDELIARLGLPMVFKPSDGGSSIGVSMATAKDEVAKGLAEAKASKSVFLAERRISGSEYAVCFVGDSLFPAIRIRTKRPFYDYVGKYTDGHTYFDCPCDLSSVESEELSDLCVRMRKVARANEWGSIDLMRDERGKWWLLELNTVPGMTKHSLTPLSAKVAGKSFNELALEILATSLPRSALQ